MLVGRYLYSHACHRTPFHTPVVHRLFSDGIRLQRMAGLGIEPSTGARSGWSNEMIRRKRAINLPLTSLVAVGYIAAMAPRNLVRSR
jgi:hypothetical protein